MSRTWCMKKPYEERWKMAAECLVQRLSSSRRGRLSPSTSDFYSLSCRRRSPRTAACNPTFFCSSSPRHEAVFHDIPQGCRRPAPVPLASFAIDSPSAFRRELSLVTFLFPPLKSACLSTFSHTRPQTAACCWRHTSSFSADVHRDTRATPSPFSGTTPPAFYQKGSVSYASFWPVVAGSRKTLRLNSRAGGPGVSQFVVKCTYSPSLRQQVCCARSRRGSIVEEVLYNKVNLQYTPQRLYSSAPRRLHHGISLKEYLVHPRCTYTASSSDRSSTFSSRTKNSRSPPAEKRNEDRIPSSAILQDPTGSLGSEGHPLLSFDLFDTAISNGRCRAVQTLGDATNDCAPRSFRLIIEWTSYLLLFLLLGATMTGQLTIIERRIDVHMKSLCMLTAVYGGISLWGLEVSRLGGKGGTGVGGRAGFSSMRYLLGCCSVGLSTLPLILSEVVSPCAGYITIAVPVLFQLLSYRFLKRQSNRLSLPFSFYRSSSFKHLASQPSSHSPTASWGSSSPTSSSSSTFCSTSVPSSSSSSVTALSPSSSLGSIGTDIATCTSYSRLSVSTRDLEKRAAKLCDTPGVSQASAKKGGVSSAVGQCKDGTASVSSFIEPMTHEKLLFMSMSHHRGSLLLPEWWGHSWRQRGLPLLLLLSAAAGCYRVNQVEATASNVIAKDAEGQRPPLHGTTEGLRDISNDRQERGLWKAFLSFFWEEDEENEGGGGYSLAEEPGELKRDRDDAAVMRKARERLLGRNKTTSGGGDSSLS